MPDRHTTAQEYLAAVERCLKALDLEAIARVMERLERAWLADAQVFIVGNGGSAATASHMATDLSKTVAGEQPKAKGLRTIALTDNVALITAWANDASYEDVFAAQLRALARPDDVLIAVSGSGSSPNILRALEAARGLQVTTIGLLGRGGGRARPLVDLPLIAASDAYGPIEDTHLVLNHLLTAYFRSWVAARAAEGQGRGTPAPAGAGRGA